MVLTEVTYTFVKSSLNNKTPSFLCFSSDNVLNKNNLKIIENACSQEKFSSISFLVCPWKDHTLISKEIKNEDENKLFILCNGGIFSMISDISLINITECLNFILELCNSKTSMNANFLRYSDERNRAITITPKNGSTEEQFSVPTKENRILLSKVLASLNKPKASHPETSSTKPKIDSRKSFRARVKQRESETYSNPPQPVATGSIATPQGSSQTITHHPRTQLQTPSHSPRTIDLQSTKITIVSDLRHSGPLRKPTPGNYGNLTMHNQPNPSATVSSHSQPSIHGNNRTNQPISVSRTSGRISNRHRPYPSTSRSLHRPGSLAVQAKTSSQIPSNINISGLMTIPRHRSSIRNLQQQQQFHKNIIIRRSATSTVTSSRMSGIQQPHTQPSGNLHIQQAYHSNVASTSENQSAYSLNTNFGMRQNPQIENGIIYPIQASITNRSQTSDHLNDIENAISKIKPKMLSSVNGTHTHQQTLYDNNPARGTYNTPHHSGNLGSQHIESSPRNQTVSEINISSFLSQHPEFDIDKPLQLPSCMYEYSTQPPYLLSNEESGEFTCEPSTSFIPTNYLSYSFGYGRGYHQTPPSYSHSSQGNSSSGVPLAYQNMGLPPSSLSPSSLMSGNEFTSQQTNNSANTNYGSILDTDTIYYRRN